MKQKVFQRFQAIAALTFCLILPSQAQKLDGVQEIIVSAPVTSDRQVNICYGAINQSSRCDYQQAPLSEMTVPFWGQIAYTHRIVPNAESRATFYVANNNDCTLHLKSETFMRNTRIVDNGNVLSWDVSQVSLGDGTNCFETGELLLIVADITVTIENDKGETSLVQVNISNAPSEKPGPNSYQLQKTVIKTAK